MARRATIINAVREDAEHVLLVDAGDALLNDRSPAKATLGKSSVEAMNLLGYDAIALGSLDLSLLTMGQLRERMSEANFPLLSANAFLTGTEELISSPYTVVEMGGTNVVILGLTDPVDTAEVRVTDPIAAAETWVPDLRKRADIIIVLSHAGLEANQRIADTVPGIDVVVGGGQGINAEPSVGSRTGALVVTAENPTPGNAAEIVGIGRFSFDKAGRLTRHEWSRTVLVEYDVGEDRDMLEWLESATW